MHQQPRIGGFEASDVFAGYTQDVAAALVAAHLVDHVRSILGIRQHLPNAVCQDVLTLHKPLQGRVGVKLNGQPRPVSRQCEPCSLKQIGFLALNINVRECWLGLGLGFGLGLGLGYPR